MPLASSTLRPGLLVSLHTSIKGNVKYAKQTIVPDRRVEVDGQPTARQAKWETERFIEDAAEHEAATTLRARVRTIVKRVCADSEFGLICRKDRADELETAINEARELARKFNDSARITRVRVKIMTGTISPDDAEAVKAINEEVRDLLDTMTSGLKNLDVKVVREAANQARSIGQMLSDQAQGRVKDVIDAVRDEARKIVKAAEQGAIEVDKQVLRAIAEARTTFLDLDGDDEVAAPTADNRALDLVPSDGVQVSVAKPVEIELEV